MSATLALAICGHFAWVQSRGAPEQAALADHELAEALSYFLDHPYLELAPAFERELGGTAAVSELRELWEAERAGRGLGRMPGSIVRRHQQTLNGLLKGARLTMAKLPAWRLGVIDRSSPAYTWLSYVTVHMHLAALLAALAFVLLLGIALEDVWGHALYAGFALVASVLAGALYPLLHGSLGMPLAGAGGLAAAVVGAYTVQGLRWPARVVGAVPLPAWLMPPAFALAEYGFARGLRPGSLDALGSMPFALHGTLFAVGVATALVLRQLGVEEKLRARDEEAAELVSNPEIDRAMEAHERGRSEEAFEILERELRARPRDLDVAVAFWTVAVATGRRDVAVPAMVSVIQDDLRKRRRADAIAHWKELAPLSVGLPVDPAVLVRLGEALLDASEPAEALEVLGRAVSARQGFTAALALRTLRVARDLDPGLTARAAARALEDPRLDPRHREELEALSGDPSAGLEQPVALEPPAASPEPEAPVAPPAVADEQESGAPTLAELSENFALDPDPPDSDAIDPDALDPDLLEAAAHSADVADEAVQRWLDPGLVEDLSAELRDADVPIETGDRGELFDEGGLNDPTGYGAVDLGEGDDSATAPSLAAAAPDPETTAPLPEDPELPTAPVLDDPQPIASPAPGVAKPSAPSGRAIKLLHGTPMALEPAALKLDVEGRGKTRLPYARLEALAVGAVTGLGEKPVLVVDLVMNWLSMTDEPLKVIRVRSDRFDPRTLLDAPSTRSAWEAFLGHLLAEADVAPLPSADAVSSGRFRRFDSLARFEREVLMASSSSA